MTFVFSFSIAWRLLLLLHLNTPSTNQCGGSVVPKDDPRDIERPMLIILYLTCAYYCVWWHLIHTIISIRSPTLPVQHHLNRIEVPASPLAAHTAASTEYSSHNLTIKALAIHCCLIVVVVVSFDSRTPKVASFPLITI